MREQVTVGSVTPQQGQREAERAQASQDELVERIARAIRRDGGVEPLKGLRLFRASSPTERYIVVQGGPAQRIARAIERLRTEFDRPLRLDDIAHELGMSVSSFHHHFKSITAMSPLQFQSTCDSKKPAG